MGDRAQVHVIDERGEYGTDIWLYTHWGGRALPHTVATAIAREERWNQVEYLARIIFSEMIRGDIEGETGYGIGNHQHGDVYRVATVDVGEKVVLYEGWNEETRGLTFDKLALGGAPGTLLP